MKIIKKIAAAGFICIIVLHLPACGTISDKIKNSIEQSSVGQAEEATIDFNQIFTDCELDSQWAVVGSDGSYLTLDTNPEDKEDYSSMAWVFREIVKVNSELGLPDSLNEKMKNTTSLDGKQEQDFDDVNVSWKYHPDTGLEVMYELK